MSAFDQIIGYDSIKSELLRYCDSFKNPEKYRQLGAKAPRGVLLHGVPGIGKTLMAECFAKECGYTTFIIRKQYSDGKFLEYITETFKEAKDNAPSVVILDDLDKFSNSDFVYRNTDEYVAVQAGIESCKEYDVFVLATANDIYVLPDSLLRSERFDRIIELQEPSSAEEEKILKSYLGKTKIDKTVDIQEILRLMSGRTCADLEKVVNDAGLSAAYAEKNAIMHEDIFNACIKLITGEDASTGGVTYKGARMVAVHEAGHVVVSEFWRPGSVNLSSIAGNGNGKGGITTNSKDYRKGNTMEDLIFEISIALAGKAATQILLGLEDTGCKADIQNAYNMAKTAVSDFCWNGFEAIQHGHDPSDFAKDNRDREISELLDDIYLETLKTINENRPLVQKVAEALLEKTTITFRDIEQIINETGWCVTETERRNVKCRKAC